MNKELTIGLDTQVELHFSLKLENGNVVDSNFDSSPATFVVGDGNLLPGFERSLFGLVAGDKAERIILPENAFGLPNENNIQVVDRTRFSKEFELSEGLVVTFADASGGEVPGVVRSFDDDKVTIDFNHPLSGKTILFQVQILNVMPATSH
ncbi:FKBP-type peptidyl-prolyl cis-trans isomerase [Teredinibacter waterburyi]|uniref:FKBP-type peptidyl-prolyl cis-trans isomerase n=1 Tax=Teredinibacter waterburyi TaxID=1500538 RepID=UPI00165FB66F|nr:peptidylprolyl isomerase [Teredinibacter waterburyi]